MCPRCKNPTLCYFADRGNGNALYTCAKCRFVKEDEAPKPLASAA